AAMLAIAVAIIGMIGAITVTWSWLQQPRPANLAGRFAFPPEQRQTKDAEFNYLKSEEQRLGFGELGQQYYRLEQHQGVAGGFYSDTRLGASISACYAVSTSLALVVDKLDIVLRGNNWQRHDPPGYNLDTIRSRLDNGGDVSNYTLEYAKDSPDGTAYASLTFPQRSDPSSCGALLPSTARAPGGVFSITLHFLR
ncbi:hypothetical protein HY218_01320, partial [Candidatus Saccharibacteria bacterium]|nr:hypothetical protein [Candidatus Saccharibacteria bacterium]